jgi:hypothetical protein
MKRIALNMARSIVGTAFLLCLAGGCVRSIQPVLKEDQLISDDHLLGNWVSSNGKSSGIVSAADEHKQYPLLYTDESGKKADLLVRLGKVGDMTIGEVTSAEPNPDASDVYKTYLLPLHSFAIIKKTTPQIVMTSMNDVWLGKYIAAHPTELATAKLDENTILITASTDDLQAFIIRHENDSGAFGDTGTFVRPGDPSTRPTTAPDEPPTHGD